jgi:hypothetical protein
MASSATLFQEQWKPVVNFEELYEVSDRGRVCRISFHNNHVKHKSIQRLLKPKYQYNRPRVDLCRDDKKKTVFVYRLVLEAFVGPCPGGFEAAHLDGDSMNCVLSNLKWATHSENEGHKKLHGTVYQGTRNKMSKLDPESIRTIRSYRREGATLREIGELFGVSPSCIDSIMKGRTWNYV